jgi:hypothetical protein
LKESIAGSACCQLRPDCNSGWVKDKTFHAKAQRKESGKAQSEDAKARGPKKLHRMTNALFASFCFLFFAPLRETSI